MDSDIFASFFSRDFIEATADGKPPISLALDWRRISVADSCHGKFVKNRTLNWPKSAMSIRNADGDLSRWMQWLLTAHVRRYHRVYRGSGHVWQRPELLSDGPAPIPRNWRASVNAAVSAAEEAALQRSIQRGTPFGNGDWARRTAQRLGL